MSCSRFPVSTLVSGLIVFALVAGSSRAVSAQQQQSFEPQVGQAGKDVVWVPTSEELLAKMLDLAKVRPDDYVVDLGSGDGRNVIGAAKRGARARGFEFNPDMVALSRRLAEQAGVSDKASFVEGDMFEADFSTASVLALFLLPDNFEKLRHKFLDLKPGSRIVVNTFGVGGGWEADETDRLDENCQSWCVAMLYYVPAKVAGSWRMPQGELTLIQEFQVVKGSLTSGGTTTPIANGRLKGDQITFVVGANEYSGRVNGQSIEGLVTAGSSRTAWTATRR
jgi:SAM-dependent methyltransferase